jgi:chromosome segregation ATPase
VSDTPRTDRLLKNINGWHYVEIERSRELELELNAANERIKRFEEALNELHSNEARLLNSNGELERRIKRLEEAGDNMANNMANATDIREYIGAIHNWTKAKEVKL